MKKLVFFILLIVLGAVRVSGQQGFDNPILPRIYENGYTIEQIKEFAKENTVYSKNYRTKLLLIINNGLILSGENVNVNDGEPLDEKWIDWIYFRVIRVERDSLPAGHSNTWKNGNYVSPCKSKFPYYGSIDRFVFGSCLIKLDKPSCANLLGYTEIINPIIENPIVEKLFEEVPVEKPWVFKEPKKEIIPNLYLPPVPKEKKKIKIGFIVIPLAAILVGGGIYLLARNHNVHHGDPGGFPPTIPPAVDEGGPGGFPPTTGK